MYNYTQWNKTKAKMAKVHRDTLDEIVRVEVDNGDVHMDLKRLGIAVRIAFYAALLSTTVAAYFAMGMLLVSQRDPLIVVVFAACFMGTVGFSMMPFLPRKR